MPIDFRPVYSSTVAEVGHDPETNEMHVRWQDGKHSIYSDVPREEFDTISNGFSVGKAIHQRVKGKYAHRYRD